MSVNAKKPVLHRRVLELVELLDLDADVEQYISQLRQVSGGVISKEDFRRIFNVANNRVTDKLFQTFGTNAEGGLELNDLIKSLTALSRQGSVNQKLQIAFKYCAKEEQSGIGKQDLQEVLQQAAQENKFQLTKDQILELSSITFDHFRAIASNPGTPYVSPKRGGFGQHMMVPPSNNTSAFPSAMPSPAMSPSSSPPPSVPTSPSMSSLASSTRSSMYMSGVSLNGSVVVSPSQMLSIPSSPINRVANPATNENPVLTPSGSVTSFLSPSNLPSPRPSAEGFTEGRKSGDGGVGVGVGDGEEERIDFDRFQKYLISMHKDSLSKLTLSTTRLATHSDLIAKRRISDQYERIPKVITEALEMKEFPHSKNEPALHHRHHHPPPSEPLPIQGNSPAPEPKLKKKKEKKPKKKESPAPSPVGTKVPFGKNRSQSEPTCSDPVSPPTLARKLSVFSPLYPATLATSAEQIKRKASPTVDRQARISREREPSTDKDNAADLAVIRQQLQLYKAYEKEENTTEAPQGIEEPKEEEKEGVFEKLHTYMKFEGAKVFWLTVFTMACVGVFIPNYLSVHSGALYDVFGEGITMARGFAHVINLMSALILFPICKRTITFFGSLPYVSRIIPLHKNIVFHYTFAIFIFLASLGHTGAHIWNAKVLVSSDVDDLNEKLNKNYPHDISFVYILFQTLPGITGVLLWVILLVMFGTAFFKKMRMNHYNLFYYTHFLFIPYYGLLLSHAMGHFVVSSTQMTGYYIAVPMSIYLLESLYRIVQNLRSHDIVRYECKPLKVLCLEVQKPFDYKCGQYVCVNVPDVAASEWHSFTITSSPTQETLSVHMKVLGDWTQAVYDAFDPTKKTLDRVEQQHIPRLRITGPYGAPTTKLKYYDYVVMIGAGIGVTPFASVLTDLSIKLQNSDPSIDKLKKVYFYWLNNNQDGFQWFAQVLKDLATKDIELLLKLKLYLTQGVNKYDIRSFLLWCSLELYYNNHGRDLITGLNSRSSWGRPNFDQVFDLLKKKYPNKRIGVFYCGPSALSKRLYKLCKKNTSPSGTCFEYHKENF